MEMCPRASSKDPRPIDVLVLPRLFTIHMGLCLWSVCLPLWCLFEGTLVFVQSESTGSDLLGFPFWSTFSRGFRGWYLQVLATETMIGFGVRGGSHPNFLQSQPRAKFSHVFNLQSPAEIWDVFSSGYPA